MTEALDPQFIDEVLGTLFSDRDGVDNPIPVNGPLEWDEKLEVTPKELGDAIKRLGSRKALGLDGIPGRVLALASGELGNHLRQLFNDCLKNGYFSPIWKEAKIVLLPKVGKTADFPSVYRSICLLDEAGKRLEKIIADRLVRHLFRDGPDLSEGQYSFRQGQSTVDAILCVRSLLEAIAADNGVALAVSLDNANAFNSLPWEYTG